LYQVGIVLHEMVNGPLPYEPSAHIDAIGNKLIKSSNCGSLADMDPFEKTKLIEGCISRRASRSQLLAMRPNKPYLSKSLKRIINKATAPDQENRYSSAIEFIAALQRLDLPDWRQTEDAFVAFNWRGWDWKIARTVSASPTAVILRKRVISVSWFGPPSEVNFGPPGE
jgi:hypothetical protein